MRSIREFVGRASVLVLSANLCSACASGGAVDADGGADPGWGGHGDGPGGAGPGGQGAGSSSGGEGGAGAASTGGGGQGVGGFGGTGGNGSDLTPPTVSSVVPAQGSNAVSSLSTISVTFSEPMAASTVTAGSATQCTGAVQVSSDGFASCVAMSGAPLSADGITFTLVPATPLASLASYDVRVTPVAEDASGNALATTFETASPFVVAFHNTVTIDGTNDFDLATDGFASSTTGAQLFVTHDETHLYLGLASPAIVTGGVGNKFAYFLLSTDPQLTAGQQTSSDAKAKFGAAGAMLYHYKERIDGAPYSEFRVANGSGWATDWGAQNKSSFRSAGFIEASIALSELGGAAPSELFITAYTVDYNGGAGAGWVFNMLSGATDGAAATPRDLVQFVKLELPATAQPNAPAHVLPF